jgi:uncharacterized protein
MLDIDEMSQAEIREFLKKMDYGHLGFVCDDQPCVMPMHYYLDELDIYLFTTVGMKTKSIDQNPRICLQVEEIQSQTHWRSIILTGLAENITQKPEMDRIRTLVKGQNSTLSPAINRTWTDSWGRAETIVIYRLNPTSMTGRTTDGASSR